jgi:hypothetical protein
MEKSLFKVNRQFTGCYQQEVFTNATGKETGQLFGFCIDLDPWRFTLLQGWKDFSQGLNSWHSDPFFIRTFCLILKTVSLLLNRQVHQTNANAKCQEARGT